MSATGRLFANFFRVPAAAMHERQARPAQTIAIHKRIDAHAAWPPSRNGGCSAANFSRIPLQTHLL